MKNLHTMDAGADIEFQTEGDHARALIDNIALQSKDKHGNTIIHKCVNTNATMVHICANSGVHINAQNFAGDTALHLAVRSGRNTVANSLLMCGADLSIRNKLGQTAFEEARSDTMKTIINRYKPGLVQAVLKGEFGAMERLVRLWCHPHSVIKDGKSALELLQQRAALDGNLNKCFNTLHKQLATLELIHAVIGDDAERVKTCIFSASNINIRFRDRKGWNLAACAIAQRNLNILKMLVEQGKCSLNLRIRENDTTDCTMPLYFMTLSAGNDECPVQIWQYVRDNMDPGQDSERDHNGNTAIFRAIENDKPADFIRTLIIVRRGANIIERNKDGLTPRDLAEELKRTDVVQLIDKYLKDQVNTQQLIRFPVAFYGTDNLHTKLQAKGPQHMEKAKHNYQQVEGYGRDLFQAAAVGDLKTIAKLNNAPYIDQNGYTALTRAVVFDQLAAAELLITDKPDLKLMPDNCNRYPLHYAYALPEDMGTKFIRLLLENDDNGIEHRVDKDGREAAEYKELRKTSEMLHMLNDARTLDPYRKRGPPLGQVPGSWDSPSQNSPSDDIQQLI